jgi:hypothetical protein
MRTFRFARPDGRPLPAAPRPPARTGDPLVALPEALAEAGVDLEKLGAEPLWDGTRLDLALAIDGLKRPVYEAAAPGADQ